MEAQLERKPREAWAPLLEGEEARKAQRILDEVAEALASPQVWEGLLPGLGQGLAGLALFFGYLALARPGEGWDEKAMELLGRAVEGLQGLAGRPGLYSGFTGVAWVVDHLQARLWGEGEDFNEDIDQALLAHLEEGPDRPACDLMAGYAGIGLYGFERRHRGAGRAILSRAVVRLEEALQGHRGEGAWVRISGPSGSPEGFYDMGVAHGVPGIIACLSHAVATGVEEVRARRLLEGAAAWMRLDPEVPLPRFRTVAGDPGPTAPGVAWCYGDLGVSVALLGAARRMGRVDWEADALRRARSAAERTGAGAGIRDPALCHGAMGAGHLFHRLHQATGEAVFASAARSWYRETLGFHQPGKGLGGFSYPMPCEAPTEPVWEGVPGFLVGTAGIGLSLLSALAPIEPAWDRVMLMDLPART